MISPTSSQPKQQQNLTKCQNRIAIYLKRKKAMTMTITSWGILSEDGLLRLQEQRRQPVWHSKEEADIRDKPLLGNPTKNQNHGWKSLLPSCDSAVFNQRKSNISCRVSMKSRSPWARRSERMQTTTERKMPAAREDQDLPWNVRRSFLFIFPSNVSQMQLKRHRLQRNLRYALILFK